MTMDKKGKASIFLGIVLFAVLGYGGFVVLGKLFSLLAELKPEVLAAIITAMATVFVGVAAVIITQKKSKQRDIEESHRPKKVEIYKGFLDAISGALAKDNENVTKQGLTEQELVDYMVEYKTDIILWGSPKVIKCQLEFEKVSKVDGNIFAAVDSLYKAIREDIGLSNKGLKNYELIKMYMKDPSEIDEMVASNKRLQVDAAPPRD